jgi:hypothetical protein
MKYQNSHLHRILAMVKTCFRFYRAVGIKKTMAKSDTKKTLPKSSGESTQAAAGIQCGGRC